MYKSIREKNIDCSELSDNIYHHKYYELILNFNTKLDYLSKCFIGRSKLSQEEIIDRTIELKKKGKFPLPTDIDPNFKLFNISQYELLDNILENKNDDDYKFFFTEKIINKFGYKKKYKDLTFFQSF